MTKAEQQILKYKQKNPKASLREIGKETGLVMNMPGLF